MTVRWAYHQSQRCLSGWWSFASLRGEDSARAARSTSAAQERTGTCHDPWPPCRGAKVAPKFCRNFGEMFAELCWNAIFWGNCFKMHLSSCCCSFSTCSTLKPALNCGGTSTAQLSNQRHQTLSWNPGRFQLGLCQSNSSLQLNSLAPTPRHKPSHGGKGPQRAGQMPSLECWSLSKNQRPTAWSRSNSACRFRSRWSRVCRQRLSWKSLANQQNNMEQRWNKPFFLNYMVDHGWHQQQNQRNLNQGKPWQSAAPGIWNFTVPLGKAMPGWRFWISDLFSPKPSDNAVAVLVPSNSEP